MDRLKEFIAHARKKGMDHATIRMLLLSAGWKEKDIAEALTEESLDMPVPVPTEVGGARDAFFHLLIFASLYTTVISSIVLFFTYLNQLFPDRALEQYPTDNSGMLTTIRWSIAALIVSFPLFLWISHIVIREMTKHIEKAVGGVRRWLTYLTLFITASALMGDVITLIFYLLQGELTLRFLLKVAGILLIAGLVFTYYFLSLRIDPVEAKQRMLHKKFGLAATLIVLAAIVWGIALTGSPMSARERQFDDRRVEDFRTIQSEIHNIVYGTNVPTPTTPIRPVPKSLDDVAAESTYQKINEIDPETNQPYVYTAIDSTHYSLCATFSAVRDLSYDISWNHPAGNHCFTVDVVTGDVK